MNLLSTFLTLSLNFMDELNIKESGLFKGFVETFFLWNSWIGTPRFSSFNFSNHVGTWWDIKKNLLITKKLFISQL